MTVKRSRQARSNSYDPSKDFLSLRGKSRFARLLNRPLLPRPRKAFLDSDGYLTWTWYSLLKEREEGDTRLPPPLRKPPADLCFQFARLGLASDKKIVAFAGKWGPLNLERRAEEHIGVWRQYATLASALLRFTAATTSGGLGDKADWAIICRSTHVGLLDRTTRVQAALIGHAVNKWYAEAHGHQIVNVVDGELQIQPTASNLFGVLITQIAHVVSRRDQMAICAGCKNTFNPKRPISNGRRQYCSRCRKAKIPQRDAARASRQRSASQG